MEDKPESFLEVDKLLMAKSGIHTKSSLEAVAKKTGTEAELKTTPNSKQVDILTKTTKPLV